MAEKEINIFGLGGGSSDVKPHQRSTHLSNEQKEQDEKHASVVSGLGAPNLSTTQMEFGCDEEKEDEMGKINETAATIFGTSNQDGIIREQSNVMIFGDAQKMILD